MYGGLRNFSSPINLTPDFIPFRQLGQYEDPELEGLYYNRFRYYDCSIGNYISQDPIGLEGNNPTFYAYVHDSNSWVDPFGLDTSSDAAILRANMIRDGIDTPNYSNSAHHIVMSNSTDPNMISLRSQMTNIGIDINDSSNGVFLPTSSKVKNDFNLDAHAHSRVHTNEYKKNVFERLKDITDPDKFKNELEKIGKELSEGTFKIKCN
ncbi:RHS repeat-associated core domain-containing protein [Flavobacterium columnare]|uniref:RHS repeat-associated core domain-containing protein n=1 Tax=Flavobacterium columnare TaxID=996 RepID=UPI0021D2C8B0|nr:AHH domain-containing protein [Flavobacterium columnare]